MIKKIFGSGRNLGLSALVAGTVAAGTLLFPATANSQAVAKPKIGNILYIRALNNQNQKPRTIEDYYKNQISHYMVKGDATRALTAEYRAEQVEKAKRTWERNGTLYPPVKFSDDIGYGWDKTEVGLAIAYVFASALDVYQSCHIPEGSQESGKLYLFNWDNSPFGAQRFFGNRPTKGETIAYAALSNLAWLAACDLVPKRVTNHFLPKRYNKWVRKAMLSLSFASSACNVYNHEKITKNRGGILRKKWGFAFRKAF